MPVVVRPAAAEDVDEAYLWYESQGTGLGENFLVALSAAIERVARNPDQYPVVHRNTRRILLDRFPYCVFYRLYGDVVVIVACMHARRNPRQWKGRR
jgi:plasmid stabilization system protein ParE